MHGLLIYIYFKDDIKKMPQNSLEVVFYRGGRNPPPPQGLTLQNIPRVSRVKLGQVECKEYILKINILLSFIEEDD